MLINFYNFCAVEERIECSTKHKQYFSPHLKAGPALP